MPKLKHIILGTLLLWGSTLIVDSQTSYFNQGFLRQPSAQADRDYLGITNGGGSGTVTSVASGNFSPLFNVSVATPTTTPTLSYTAISQGQNLFYASPDGAAGVPSFRGLVTGDLPDISSIVRGDVSASAPILYDAATGIFSMHVADSTHDGYLSSVDWTTFNGKGVGTVITITNSGIKAADNSLVAVSNAPTLGIKSVSAGPNMTVTDQGGTNLILSANAGGGGGVAGADLLMNTLTAYDGQTNFYIDFNYPASTIQSTGDIVFNYSTNWGLSATSRVCNVFIPATNIYRRLMFVTAATNWHDTAFPIVAVPCGFGARLQMQLFGQGETNVAYTPSIDLVPVKTNWIAGTFNPTNSIGGCVLWWEASQKIFQDEFGKTPAVDGSNVRALGDNSGTVANATNIEINTFCFYHGPNSAPGNIPCLNFLPVAKDYLVTPTFANIAQPNWAFIMYYGRGSSLIMLDGLSEGNRFACQVSETPGIPGAVYSGTSLTFTPGTGIGWRLFSFLQNGASSVIRTNGVQAAAGNSGAQTPSRWVLGSDFTLTTAVGNNYVAEVLVMHTNLTLVQLTNVENYFRAKYPFQ